MLFFNISPIFPFLLIKNKKVSAPEVFAMVEPVSIKVAD